MVKSAKDLLTKPDTLRDEYDKKSEELNQILQTVGAAIYQQQQAPGPQPGQEAPPEEPKTDAKKDVEEGEVVN